VCDKGLSSCNAHTVLMWCYPREVCGAPAQHGAELPRASKWLLPTHGRDAYIDAYRDALWWHGIVDKGTCGKRKIHYTIHLLTPKDSNIEGLKNHLTFRNLLSLIDGAPYL